MGYSINDMLSATVKYRKPKAFSRKHITAAVKAALGAVGLDWHRKTLPDHFKPGAESRYRYQRRTPKHLADKLKQFGHQRPLVFTGTLAAEVQRLARITSTGKGVRVVMKGPKYLYMRRRDQKQPDKAKELTATTRKELTGIGRSLHDRLKRSLSATAETVTTK